MSHHKVVSDALHHTEVAQAGERLRQRPDLAVWVTHLCELDQKIKNCETGAVQFACIVYFLGLIAFVISVSLSPFTGVDVETIVAFIESWGGMLLVAFFSLFFLIVFFAGWLYYEPLREKTERQLTACFEDDTFPEEALELLLIINPYIGKRVARYLKQPQAEVTSASR